MMQVARATRLFAAAALVIAGAIQLPSRVSGQERRPTFTARVALVPITAVVRDAKSRIVMDLKQQDFRVLENDQPREIIDFRSTNNGPVSLALLFDTSGSMGDRYVSHGKQVVDRLLSGMDGPADEISLFTFDKALRQETPFTSDLEAVRTALAETDSWGLTSIYDAIAGAASHVGQRQSQRRALLLITDGLDTSSALSPQEVAAAASAIDVPVYVVAVAPPRLTAKDEDGPRDSLSELAFATGGGLRHVTALSMVDEAIRELMIELRQQYFLAIASAPEAGWYRLAVTTKKRGLTVRAREGYSVNRAPRSF